MALLFVVALGVASRYRAGVHSLGAVVLDFASRSDEVDRSVVDIALGQLEHMDHSQRAIATCGQHMGFYVSGMFPCELTMLLDLWSQQRVNDVEFHGV